MVVLGAGAGIDTVDRWLQAAADGGYTGFAVGRSIWADAVLAHDRGELDAPAARAQIAGRYGVVHRHLPRGPLTELSSGASTPSLQTVLGSESAIAVGNCIRPTGGTHEPNASRRRRHGLGDDGRRRCRHRSTRRERPEGDITVWAMGAEGDNLGVLADAFMEEFPDVSVEVTAVPWDAAHERSSPPSPAARSPT